MFSKKTLADYCDLVIKIGVNLQKGQGLEIICPTEKREIAHALTKSAYQAGASIVRVRWEDQEIEKTSLEYAQTEQLLEMPKWLIDRRNYIIEKNFCYVCISADDPQAFKNINPKKLAQVSQAKSVALRRFTNAVMANKIRWCVVSVPTKSWAKKVFPKSKNPQRELSLAIEKTMRLNYENPFVEWSHHIQTLKERANFLNEKRFSYLHFKNSKGTDLIVGLANDHLWTSAMEKAVDGIEFVANLPTEEVFTAPHKYKVDGVLKSALPLCENGKIIDDFSITFKNGKIIDFSANKGYETLKGLIQTDKGTSRLGEVALIGKNSPIAKSGILFFNTLFDENASCHLAIGNGYPTTIINGENLTKKQLEEKGLNSSSEHIDFMIGTNDLSVVGVDENEQRITLFEDGDWVI